MNGDKPVVENFAFIDWARGLAALLVAYFHYELHVVRSYPVQQIPPGSLASYFVFGAFDLGKFGVALFFLVSGFLIPATLAAAGARIGRFSLHRFFRLYPAYWVSLLVFVVVEAVAGRWATIDWAMLSVNATMLQKFVGVADAVGAYWTLQIELIFYGLCVLLFSIGRLGRREWVVILSLVAGLICAWIRYRTGKAAPVALCIALALMFVGDGLRALAERRTSGIRVGGLIAVTAISLVPIVWLAYGPDARRYLVTYWLAMVGFLVVFGLREKIAQARRANVLGRWLADCSYGVYLLHGSIGMAFGRFVFSRTGDAALTALAMFGVSYGLAYLSFIAIERPLIRMGRRLADQLVPPRLSAQQEISQT